MDMSIMRELTSDQLKNDIPDFNPGDTLRIHVRVIEGEKERLQVFEGNVIQRKGSGIQETVTVRKVTQGSSRRAHIPSAFSPGLANREHSPRQGAAGSPVLSAQPQGEGRANQRKAVKCHGSGARQFLSLCQEELDNLRHRNRGHPPRLCSS